MPSCTLLTMGVPHAATRLVAGRRSNMAAPAGVVSMHNIEAAADTATDKGAQCTWPESMPRETQTPRTCLRSAACQTQAARPGSAAGSYNKSRHGATSSSATSTCRDAPAGNWPKSEVDVLQTGVCCISCCKFFVRRDGADRHWRLHHGAGMQAELQEPFWCPYCQFSSYIRRCVQAHERNHSEEEAYACQLFPEQRPLGEVSRVVGETVGGRSARKKAQPASPHVCSACQRVFALRQHLVVHERVHTGERPFVCGVCEKRFRRKDALTVHERVHRKPHACQLCGHRFADKKELDAHGRMHVMHLGRRPHVCGVCRESFWCKEKLALHESSVHCRAVERPYACITCHESFPHRVGLLRHNCQLIRSRMLEMAIHSTLGSKP